MSPIVVGAGVFACLFGGVLLGLALRGVLPAQHLSPESRDIVKLGTGLIGTMAALLLGLQVASAKGSYDTVKSELTQLSAKVVFLDRVLANYGPEAQQARQLLRGSVAQAMARIWPSDASRPAQLDPSASGGESLLGVLHQLSPQNELQQALKAQAMAIANEIAQTRWLLFSQTEQSISVPFMVVVVCWLTVIFTSFGLMAPRNATVIVTLLLCAMSVAGAIFLITEMDGPFEGLIRVSAGPMQHALERMGG